MTNIDKEMERSYHLGGNFSVAGTLVELLGIVGIVNGAEEHNLYYFIAGALAYITGKGCSNIGIGLCMPWLLKDERWRRPIDKEAERLGGR